MATTHALDAVTDPLLTPLLAFLRDAVNADLAEVMEAAALASDVETTDAVKLVAARPLDLLLEGDGSLPMLGCFRTRVRTKQATFGYKENYTSLQFRYLTPACGVEKLDQRWPLLHRVWERIIAALEAGSHPAHRDGINVLDQLGVTWVSFDTSNKQELFVERGDFSFPGFVAEIELRTQLASEADAGTFPALSFMTKIFAEPAEPGAGRQPDVQVIDYTEIGEQERDAQPFDDEQELGSQML